MFIVSLTAPLTPVLDACVVVAPVDAFLVACAHSIHRRPEFGARLHPARKALDEMVEVAWLVVCGGANLGHSGQVRADGEWEGLSWSELWLILKSPGQGVPHLVISMVPGKGRVRFGC